MSMARWTRRLLFSDTTTTVSRQTFCLFHTLIFFLFCAGGKFRKLPESCLPLDKAVTVACNMATNHDKTHKTHILLSASRWTGILCRVTNHCDGCQVLSNQTRACDWQESFFFFTRTLICLIWGCRVDGSVQGLLGLWWEGLNWSDWIMKSRASKRQRKSCSLASPFSTSGIPLAFSLEATEAAAQQPSLVSPCWKKQNKTTNVDCDASRYSGALCERRPVGAVGLILISPDFTWLRPVGRRCG